MKSIGKRVWNKQSLSASLLLIAFAFAHFVFCIYVSYRQWAIFSWIVASSCRSGRIFDIWISGQILTGRRGGGCFPEILNSLFSLRKNLNSQSSIPSSQKLSIPCIMTSIIKSSIIKIEASGFNLWTAGQLQCLLDRGGKFQNKRKENTSSFYKKSRKLPVKNISIFGEVLRRNSQSCILPSQTFQYLPTPISNSGSTTFIEIQPIL